MLGKTITLFITAVIAGGAFAQTPTIREYTVLRTPGGITVDGKLNEPGWKSAPFTQPFVIYHNGETPKQATRAQMLWDDTFLYIAFTMEDRDVWAATKKWYVGDKCLCLEEVAEVFIDPDGDGLNYLEAEINPYGALMALRLDKEFAKGGSGDYSWTYKKLGIGIGVNGSLNDSTDVDKSWICEMAFPFEEIAFTAPSRSFPPKQGEFWRINLYRYDYPRPLVKGGEELSAWNRTRWGDEKSRGFHAPNYFGKIIYSDKVAGK